MFLTTTAVTGLNNLMKRNNRNDIPNLDDLAPTIYGTKLNYRVAFGDEESPFTMNGLQTELTSELRTSKKSSTGIHTAALLKKPWYIDDKGEQFVDLENGGWEVGWSSKSPHGLLICSFVAPTSLQRNENAKMDSGRFYINHRVWTSTTLESERERRRKIQAEAAQHLDTRDKKIKEITDERNTNAASKVVSYAQAADARNKYFTSGYRQALYIPLYDDQVLRVNDQCIISTRGEIFKVDDQSRNAIKVGLSRVDFLLQDTNQDASEEENSDLNN